jgi:autotransporter-associated beta strand protein
MRIRSLTLLLVCAICARAVAGDAPTETPRPAPTTRSADSPVTGTLVIDGVNQSGTLQLAPNPHTVVLNDGNDYTGSTTISGGRLATQHTINVNITTEKVKAAFLGVETASAGETLRAQLKLPAGVGLAVKHVEGPAKDAGVQQHDVLYKLNEQLLVNTDQLAVLVRTFKPGEKVELTLIREAQPVKVTATLVEKEVEALSGIREPAVYNFTDMAVPEAKSR